MSDFLTLGGLLRLARDTVTDPQEGATTVLSVAPPARALWLMFALVITLSTFFTVLVSVIVPPGPEGPLTGRAPLMLGLLQGAFLFVMIHAIHRIGRAFGGTGRFEETFILVIWLQFILICAQVLQAFTMVVVPPMAGIVTLLALGLFFWLLTNFIAVLHGFTSLGMVFVMTLVSGFGIIFALSLVLSLLGLMPSADMSGL